MDASQVRKIVRDALPRMRWALGLEAWNIGVDVVHIGVVRGEGRKADVSVNAKYHRASIRIDPECADTIGDVLESLRHECLHVLHWAFYHYRDQTDSALPVPNPSGDVLNETFMFAAERTVAALEHMLDHGIGLPVRAMLNLSKKHDAKALALRGWNVSQLKQEPKPCRNSEKSGTPSRPRVRRRRTAISRSGRHRATK